MNSRKQKRLAYFAAKRQQRMVIINDQFKVELATGEYIVKHKDIHYSEGFHYHLVNETDSRVYKMIEFGRDNTFSVYEIEYPCEYKNRIKHSEFVVSQ